jgi:hypothetical protein
MISAPVGRVDFPMALAGFVVRLFELSDGCYSRISWLLITNSWWVLITNGSRPLFANGTSNVGVVGRNCRPAR